MCGGAAVALRSSWAVSESVYNIHELFHGKNHITSDNMEMARSTGGTSCKSYTVSVSTFCCTYNVSCNLRFYACLKTRLENNCGNVYINHRHSNTGPRYVSVCPHNPCQNTNQPYFFLNTSDPRILFYLLLYLNLHLGDKSISRFVYTTSRHQIRMHFGCL